MLKAIYIKRLRDVIVALKMVPEKSFNISIWKSKTDCGTLGCAVGWYAMKFPRRDLKLIFRNRMFWPAIVKGGKRFTHPSKPILSVAQHFGLSATEAEGLFLHSGYDYCNVTRKTVITKLREFIKSQTPKGKR